MAFVHVCLVCGVACVRCVLPRVFPDAHVSCVIMFRVDEDRGRSAVNLNICDEHETL